MPRPGPPTVLAAAVVAAVATAAGFLPSAALAGVGGTGGDPVVTTQPMTPDLVVDPGRPGPPTVDRPARRTSGTATGTDAGTDAGAAGDGGDGATASAAAPLLHSRPGSARTILLDFDGQTVSDTQWSSDAGLPNPYVALPWSLDTDPTLSAAENARIEQIWAAVAEDYSPFDVDVTTEDPGDAAITRSSASDTVYGTRALVTDSDAWNWVCGGTRCGGVAYIDVYDATGTGHTRHQPAWVFPQNLGDDVKNLADAISHEVGHTLGLRHDGTPSAPDGYYGGQGSWGPIMGSPGSRPISQWSLGEYAGASNTQDDLAVLGAGGVPLRTDEAGGTTSSAATGLPVGAAVISTRNDVDVYRLSSCSGDVAVRGTPAAFSPDLDMELRLYDAAGNQLDAQNPASATVSRSVASGMDATVSTSAARGDLFVRVDGTGQGDPASTGYSDYASVGQYTLALSGSCSGTASAPTAVRSLAGTVDGGTARLTWAAPASAGSSPVSGYQVTTTPGNGSLSLSGNATSATVTGLARGATYDVAVVARNATGNGPPSTLRVVTAPATPGAVVDLDVTTGASSVKLSWDEPTEDGGSPVTGYRFRLGGGGQSIDRTLGAAVGSITITGLEAGTYSASVSALNAFGEGANSRATVSLGAGQRTSTALVASAAPRMSGRPTVGRKVSVTTGAFSRPVKLAYRWRVGTKTVGTGPTYKPRAGQVGDKLSVTVTATASGLPSLVLPVKGQKIKR